MGILVGFHVEGWDHLIVRSFLAALLGIPEGELVPDWIDAPGRGWQFVLRNVDQALRRFYTMCAQLAVIGVDNDGNMDLVRSGAREDPRHPRHWNHAGPTTGCRHCAIDETVARVRASLPALPQKPPQTWPVIVVVPVETVEAWVLELQAIINPAIGLAQAERRQRGSFKMALYGQPEATRAGVERVALPLIRSATAAQIGELRNRSCSFDLFAAQLEQSRSLIMGPRDCWAPGDAGAARTAPQEG